MSSRDAPPSKTCFRALTELSEKSYKIRDSGNDIDSNFISISDLKINDLNLSEHVYRLENKKFILDSYHKEGKIPNFESTVSTKIISCNEL